jgi:transposase-like protein
MRKVRQFSREFKLSILNELETKRLCEVCRAHDLAPSTVKSWTTDYDKNPKEAFKGKGNLYKEEAKIAEYERLMR